MRGGSPPERFVWLASKIPTPADARADKYAHPFGVLRRDLQAGLLHRLLRCRKGKMNEAPHLARFLLVYKVQRVKVLDLGGKSDRKPGCVEPCNRRHTPGASYQLLPHFRTY